MALIVAFNLHHSPIGTVCFMAVYLPLESFMEIKVGGDLAAPRH